ncbi:hypothetical protein GQ54DRAFT_193201 [Martensiomyces pterosporus]|nr:hypothetical protein GQ54DRAFT_193201 [Martensiomyces pterosporus]
MANKAISPATMRGVLAQLPGMSGKIVDDTRHEKVLSYMRLFLESPTAIDDLLDWAFLRTLAQCLQPSSDYRVSSVAVRFLGDAIAVPKGKGRETWAVLNQDDDSGQRILSWVVDNADSKHALVRFACLYFTRQAAKMGDEHFGRLRDALGHQAYVMRRLLDASYFVVTEACRLLASIFYSTNSGSDPAEVAIDPAMRSLIKRLVDRPFDLQSTARKTAILAAMSTLFSIDIADVHDAVIAVFDCNALKPYLFDSDRLIRDQALDLLEVMLRVEADYVWVNEALQMVTCADILREDGRDLDIARTLVALRGLSAIVKAVRQNAKLAEEAHPDCLAISWLALSILSHMYGCAFEWRASPLSSRPQSICEETLSLVETQVLQIVDGGNPGAAKAANSIACEASRIVREFCRYSFDWRTFTVLQELLGSERAQRNTRLLQTILDAMIQALRRSKQENFEHLLELPGLISNFSVDSPGLKMLFALVLEILSDHDEYDSALRDEFLKSLSLAIKARLADVEWEARDTAFEFISTAIDTVGWTKVRPLITHGSLIEDAVGALKDPEAYVRASSTQALVSIVLVADDEMRLRVVGARGVGAESLALLVADSEAFVKRAALELVCAYAQLAVDGRLESGREWLHVLTYPKLHQLADDPDFEVRVRCAKLLATLTRWLHASDCENEESEYLGELQVGSLLVDMCRDSSRYVRRVCLDSLVEMKQILGSSQAENSAAAQEKDGEESAKRAVLGGSTAEDSFYRKLCSIDFRRLEAGLTTEHLYQEALDTQVESELMKETRDPNLGNNILDCY